MAFLRIAPSDKTRGRPYERAAESGPKLVSTFWPYSAPGITSCSIPFLRIDDETELVGLRELRSRDAEMQTNKVP